MHFCDKKAVRAVFHGKTVALVGSGPGSLENKLGFVDSHDVVVRVNNYRTGLRQGTRCDVFYSFFGTSIKKTAAELKMDGVKFCLCKCPNAKFIESAWHREKQKPHGVDFRYIYRDRANWWFCPTYVPSVVEFMEVFDLLTQRIPTTGFSALCELLRHEPAGIYMTGFDFFASKIHNVDERWQAGDPDDPIGHNPRAERAWLMANKDRLPITMDAGLRRATT